MSDEDHLKNMLYLKRKLKRLAQEIDVLQKKATTEHLGHHDSNMLKLLMADQEKFAKRLKREKYSGKTKIE
jgi:hypothetical protein